MVYVTHDGSQPGEVQENCCLCRRPTRYWYTPKDVALCNDCAKDASPNDLPTKEEWCAKEVALSPRRFVNYH